MCDQVVLAVATDGEGIPIHVEVLKGNRGRLMPTGVRGFGARQKRGTAHFARILCNSSRKSG